MRLQLFFEVRQNDLDATLSRALPVHERAKLELHFEFFDLTNNPNSATHADFELWQFR